MPDPNSDDDEAFARDAFSRLDPLEPSAALLRRVAAIPIELPLEPKRAWWAVWEAWPARWAIVAALGLGALVGAFPLEDSLADSSATAQPSSDDGELEDALALAFGEERSSGDLLAEEQ